MPLVLHCFERNIIDKTNDTENLVMKSCDYINSGFYINISNIFLNFKNNHCLCKTNKNK